MTMLPYRPIDPALRARADQAYAEDTRGGGTLLDAANVLGRKEQAIKNLLNRQQNIGSSLDANGKFDIPWNERFFGGINDDDIAKALLNKDQRDRVNSQLGQDALRLGVDFNASTTQGSLQNKVEEAGYVKDLSKALNALGPEGAVALAKLKKNNSLSSDTLLSTTIDVERAINDKNPDVLAQRAAAAQSLKASQATIDGAASDRSFQETQQTFNNQMSDRTQTFQESQARNRWDDKREARRESALTRQMNAENNAMQMQLEYSRLAQADETRAQDRKDKAIMALLSGLGNLGAGFTI